MAHHEEHDSHDAHHGLGHVVPVKILLATFGALMVFTIATVAATKVNFGYTFNLAIAMAIAAVKATIVVLFFMHLRWDKRFHSVVLIGGLLAAVLFVGFALMDSNQYQESVIWDKDVEPPFSPKPIYP